MKINQYGFFGFVSLLGLFGFYFDDPRYFCYFGAAVFLLDFFVLPDETFVEYTRKSASNAFFAGQATMVLVMAGYLLFVKEDMSRALLLATTLASSVSVGAYALSRAYFEFKEKCFEAVADWKSK